MSGKMNLRDKLENDTLDLSMSDLEQVPVKEIAALKRCYHLDLSNNILTTLPKNFATLTQIVKLDLSKNMLTEIPENFGELRALKHLDLYSNRISRLPLSLGELKNLKWLDLKENPLTPAVASVAGPCSNANECQACAKKIVNYLAKVKLTVEEEKKRRLEAAPVEEKKATSNKKEGKKKKKNVEKKIVEKEKSNLIEDNDYQEEKKIINSNHKPEYYSESKGGVFKSMCQIFIAFTIWLAFIMLFAITAVTLFRLYDKQQSEDILKYIEAQTGVSLKTYHQECLIFLETFLSKIELWVNETKLLSKKIYEDYFVKQFNNLKK